MKERPVRTSIDVPRDLHRKIHELAARRGCSARQLILESIETAVHQAAQRPKRRLALDRPIVGLKGKPFNLTNEQIHDLIEFP